MKWPRSCFSGPTLSNLFDIAPFLRRARVIMRLFIYGSRSALLSVILLGILGCSESNESIVEEQARKTAGAKVEESPPPKNEREFGERSQQNNPLAKGRYPGTGPAAKK